jgi:salicylate hydroxylase
MPSNPPLRIAIAGAGIAGLTIYLSLIHQYQANPSLLSITLYEQAPKLEEIGASIALGPNGLRTLQRLNLQDVISSEECFRGPSDKPMIYRHWKMGEVIGWDSHDNVVKWEDRTARFHRGHLHGALLRHVPKDRVVLGKKVVGVDFLDGENGEDGVRVMFQDGSAATADILVGADGLRSVRPSFLPVLLNSCRWGK